jgi:hypothetical protein
MVSRDSVWLCTPVRAGVFYWRLWAICRHGLLSDGMRCPSFVPGAGHAIPSYGSASGIRKKAAAS